MATNFKYPIATSDELKKVLSWIDRSFDLDNVKSGFLMSADDLEDIISTQMYKVMIDHYNSDNYTADDWTVNDYGKKNQLVDLSIPFIANLGLYHHFIFLQVRTGNHGITTYKGKDETTAFKYQTDEAKDSLLKTAWLYAGKLIDFLVTTSTEWTLWAKTVDYLQNQKIKEGESYYKANADFTSGEEFVVGNWTIVESAEIIFPEWRSSEQATDLVKLIFSSYKDFDKYYGIDKNAAFYMKARYLILEIIEDSLDSRIKDITTITDSKLLIKVKRYLSFQTMALAVVRLDSHCLPESMRKRINENERSYGSKENAVEKISLDLLNKGGEKLRDIDNYLAETVENENETLSPAIQHEVHHTDKHISLI